MIQKRAVFFRTASFLLLISFIVQELSFAAPEFRPTEVKLFEKPSVKIAFPESVASVEDAWLAPVSLRAKRSNLSDEIASGTSSPRNDSRLVYLIQDAHTNPSGQINLSKALDHLFKEEKDLKYIFVEAGVGNNSLTALRKIAPLNKRKQVAEEYLRKGLLHGEEYLDLTNDRDFTIWGVEDAGLYAKSLEVYKHSVKQREKFELYLDKVEGSVKALKPRIFNPSLLAFDEINRKFQSATKASADPSFGGKEEISFTDYFDELLKQAEKRSVSIGYFPNLYALRSLKDREKAIDFKKASEEQEKAIQSLPDEASKEVLSYIEGDNKRSAFTGGIQELDRKRAFYALLM